MKNGVLVALGVAIWAALKGVAKIIKVVITVLTNVIIFFGLYIPLFYGLFGVLLLAFTDFTLGGTGTNQVLYYVGLGLSFFASLIITVRTLFVRPISAIFEPLVNLIRDYRERKAARRAEKEGYEEDFDPEGYGDDDRRDRYRDGGSFVREPLDYAPRYPAYPAYEDRYADRSGRAYPSRDPYAPSRDMQGDPRGRYMPPRDFDRQGGYAEEPYDAAPPAYGDPYPGGARPPYDAQRDEGARRDYGDARAPYGDTAYPRFGARIPREPVEAERPLIYYSRRRPGILVKEYSDRFDLYREDMNGRVFIGTEYKGE